MARREIRWNKNKETLDGPNNKFRYRQGGFMFDGDGLEVDEMGNLIETIDDAPIIPFQGDPVITEMNVVQPPDVKIESPEIPEPVELEGEPKQDATPNEEEVDKYSSVDVGALDIREIRDMLDELGAVYSRHSNTMTLRGVLKGAIAERKKPNV